MLIGLLKIVRKAIIERQITLIAIFLQLSD